MEDSTYEPDEQFLVRLSDAEGNEFCKASIGTNNSAIVTITDREDGEFLGTPHVIMMSPSPHRSPLFIAAPYNYFC